MIPFRVLLLPGSLTSPVWNGLLGLAVEDPVWFSGLSTDWLAWTSGSVRETTRSTGSSMSVPSVISSVKTAPEDIMAVLVA